MHSVINRDSESTQIRLRWGDVELEVAGTEEFVLQNSLALATRLMGVIGPDRSGTKNERNGTAGSCLKMTTNNVASKLGGGTGTELAAAAAAKLTLVDDKETFSRAELLAEMKSAHGFYKGTFSRNLSSSLASLVKGDKLREIASGRYALEARTKQGFLSRLAE